MGAPRPETIIMREAREMARDDRLRVTVRIGDMTITVEPSNVAKPVDAQDDAGLGSSDGGISCQEILRRMESD
jgi:hypothetical protein